MTFACAPLSPNGLCSVLALSLSDNRRELDQAFVPEIDIVLSVCAGLVTVDEDANVVRLVHYTTQEYLTRNREQWSRSGQLQMALACIRYRSLEEFKNFAKNLITLPMENGTFRGIIDISYKAISERLPFFEYAAQYWNTHARVVESIVVEEIYTMITHIGILQSIASVTH
jgi:hypothetical protein